MIVKEALSIDLARRALDKQYSRVGQLMADNMGISPWWKSTPQAKLKAKHIKRLHNNIVLHNQKRQKHFMRYLAKKTGYRLRDFKKIERETKFMPWTPR